MKKLTRGAYATDIHFGKKANSEVHNKDCINYIDWFCEQVQKQNCDYIAFLGDWNENRNALNVGTLNYSYQGAKKLNDLNIPVYFCIGNHDLYHRHTREIHSVIPFTEFSNFHIIDQPTIVKNIGDNILFCPYIFHDEYPALQKFSKIPIWAGHFEFKGFVITGYNIEMLTGPDLTDFKGPSHIFSGHFHRRQSREHVHYIGNTFPMDFGDAGDTNRGMMVFDHITNTFSYTDWDNCPKYIKTKLTDILDKSVTIYPESRIKCVVDVPISFEESTYLRQEFIEKYNLREFSMEESKEIITALTETQTNIDINDVKLDSVDELVTQMLNDIKSEHIDNNLLINIYRSIKNY